MTDKPVTARITSVCAEFEKAFGRRPDEIVINEDDYALYAGENGMALRPRPPHTAPMGERFQEVKISRALSSIVPLMARSTPPNCIWCESDYLTDLSNMPETTE